MQNYTSLELEKIKTTFSRFAEHECKDNSNLYYQLSKNISQDDEVAEIATFVKYGQPIPNSFLASIHYLLLKNPSHNLANYYPSISNQKIERIPFELFKRFVLEQESEIKKIISTKIVQTNVINRCAYLLPIFSNIIKNEQKPTTLIDIGTSAGLTMNFNKYEYNYNGKTVFGNSRVKINCNIKDGPLPPIYPIDFPIYKIGIDQNIINPTDDDEKHWLKGLIWADQVERFIALEEALKLEELKNIHFVKGQTIEDFQKEIAKVNNNQILIIYATHTLYQFSQEMKEAFWKMLDNVGKQRNFYYLSVEGIPFLKEKYKVNETVVELTIYKNKLKSEKLIAETNGHGNWIKWYS